MSKQTPQHVDPYQQGFEAHGLAQGVETNPHPAGSQASKLWCKGWVAAHNNRIGAERCYQSPYQALPYGD